ncbi:C-type lectin domain family 4 member E [Biomphalaria pfeifferi]|uniref:C-type lectin domain family 4 member E n=1 Tax=Biomphalaria pfeifferi TaxID=112525 RepID=A0AAD8ASP7_BIOPF|nr:C-type lectin domain family 4 member E [Biomphalaria pfeifferi]
MHLFCSGQSVVEVASERPPCYLQTLGKPSWISNRALLIGAVNPLSTSHLHQCNQVFVGVLSIGQELTSISVLDCAIHCLKNQTFCKGFSYDLQTGRCTFGYCIIPWPNSTSPTVQLYQVQQPKCDSSPGFQVYTSGNISACLWMSSTQNNYTEAAAHCVAMGATLMSLKYVEKMNILKKNCNTSVYVGLDDLGTEGTFVWHDDQTVLESELLHQIFISGEPNDSNNNEDCVEYRNGYLALNDIICSEERDYVTMLKLVFIKRQIVSTQNHVQTTTEHI